MSPAAVLVSPSGRPTWGCHCRETGDAGRVIGWCRHWSLRCSSAWQCRPTPPPRRAPLPHSMRPCAAGWPSTAFPAAASPSCSRTAWCSRQATAIVRQRARRRLEHVEAHHRRLHRDPRPGGKARARRSRRQAAGAGVCQARRSRRRAAARRHGGAIARPQERAAGDRRRQQVRARRGAAAATAPAERGDRRHAAARDREAPARRIPGRQVRLLECRLSPARPDHRGRDRRALRACVRRARARQGRHQ